MDGIGKFLSFYINIHLQVIYATTTRNQPNKRIQHRRGGERQRQRRAPGFCSISKSFSFSFLFYYTNYLQGNLHDDDQTRTWTTRTTTTMVRIQGLEMCRTPGICKFHLFSFIFTLLTNTIY